ncbi:MAG: hypothetical protein JWQ98_2230 [Chlorobi bacterium]|nr:hypothetical protein [Chlorobiota bacterium]
MMFIAGAGIFLGACSNVARKPLEGMWAIKSITQDGKDISIGTFYINSIILNADGTCDVPGSQTVDDTRGTWEIFSEDDRTVVTMKSKNPYFNGRFNLLVSPDDPSVIALQSSRTTVTLHKFAFPMGN